MPGIERVALVFDNTIRPDTTGTYCLRALQKITQVEHFLPEDLSRVPTTGFDLYLNIDDGLRYRFPPELRPSAWWAIDTHLDGGWYAQKARDFEVVFTAQRDGAERLQLDGLEHVEWLPLGCDPDIHRRWNLPNKHDVCFIGNVNSQERAELLALIQKEFPNSRVDRAFFEDMARAYSESRIVFNRSIRNDVNMRVFEALACGSMLITNNLVDNGQSELFLDGVHLATYNEPAELLDKVKFYLQREDIRERIEKTGQSQVLAHHTYGHRMQIILTCVHEHSRPSIASSSTRPSHTEPTAVTFETHASAWAELIPACARDILYVGCGTDSSPQELQPEQDVHSSKINIDLREHADVFGRIDDAFWSDTQPEKGLNLGGEYDCVICNGVLEKCEQASRLIAMLAAKLAPKGLLILQVANLRSWAVLDTIAAGSWPSEPGLTAEQVAALIDESGCVGNLAGVVQESEKSNPTRGRFQIANAKWDRDLTARELLFVVQPAAFNTSEAGEQQDLGKHPVLSTPSEGDALRVISTHPTQDTLSPEWRLVPKSARKVLYLGDAEHKPNSHLFAEPSQVIVSAPFRCMNRWSPGESIVCTNGEGKPVSLDPLQYFDCIIYSDSETHINWRSSSILGTVKQWLTPDGSLVTRMRNVRYHRFIAELLDGSLPRKNLGSTQTEIEQLLYRHQYRLDELHGVPGDGHDSWLRGERPATVSLDELIVDGLESSDAEEFFLEEFVMRAMVQTEGQRSLTSIVIPVHNEYSYTEQCLASIVERTEGPLEIIVVDNASTDETAEQLGAMSDVVLISNHENRGFSAAVNQGIGASHGEQIVVMNNDTIVTTGWLDRMLRAFANDSRIGLVGPSSNAVSGPQQIASDYDRLEDLDGFAWRWGKAHDGQIEDSDRLVGFCMLVPRKLINAIGLFDERFGMGNFEDDDLTLRARLAGYRTVIARDAFVHHYGGQTFLGIGVDYGKLLKENQRKFQDKWKQELEPKGPVFTSAIPHSAQLPQQRDQMQYGVRRSEAGGLLLTTKPIQISLCMIVRDNKDTLGAALESIRPWVDEMIVVDTGSVDQTPEIASQLGAHVFRSDWPDSFAIARNESVQHASGEWIFWMDSDDTISPECGRKLRDLAGGQHDPSILGYVMQVHCPAGSEDGSDAMTVVDHVKLFRNRPDLRFENRIHEQILPSIRAADGEVAWTDIFVVHSGSDQSDAGRRRKQDRDLRLLELELADRPDHQFTLFNLGMTYSDMGEHDRAIEFLQKSIDRTGPNESHLRKAYALLIGSLTQSERYDDAHERCQTALSIFPDDAELRFREGILAHQFREYDAAIAAYERALEDKGPRHFSSVDPGITGFKARHNLAIVYDEVGNLSAAEQQWKEVVCEVPTYRAGWRGLGENLIAQGRLEDVVELANQLGNEPDLRSTALLLRGNMAASKGEYGSAITHLKEAMRADEDDVFALRALCRLLFEHGPLDEADNMLSRLVEKEPKDASAHQNLGTLRLRADKPAAAIKCFEASIQLRRDSATAHLYHGNALQQLNRISEAIYAWNQASQLAPESQSGIEARQHIERAEATSGSTRRDPVVKPSSPPVSMIISVLESYEIVRRQLLYFDQVLPHDWEFILVDDGSNPPIQLPDDLRSTVRIIKTNDQRRWTQGLARNLGAKNARGDYLLMTDIDHVISKEAIQAVGGFDGARMMFPRTWAVLDERGVIHSDDYSLAEAGIYAEDHAMLAQRRVHPNTFAVKRSIFVDLLGGYDVEICGRGHYGGDDIELNERYEKLVQTGTLAPDVLGPTIYVHPDVGNTYHALTRD